MNSRKDFKIKAIPDTLKYKIIEIPFRIDPSDIGRQPDEVLKIEDDLMISNISKGSFHNGLIMGDRILKVNGNPVRNKGSIVPILKGGDCILEISRREYISIISPDRSARTKLQVRPGYSYFIVNAVRPANVPSNAPMGMTIKAVKNRALLTNIEQNSVSSLFFAVGDCIVDFDGNLIPFGDTTFIREEIGKFQKNGRFSVLVERPITPATTNELRKYLLSIMPAENDFEMAPDVKAIGLEASNMHALIFRKLKPPSILLADVRKLNRTRSKVTQTEEERSIKISTASTEMRITSDVEDESDLKDVVKKSHAASGSSGFFDDE